MNTEAHESRIAALEARLAELSDRDAIRECLYRYCRGIDRCDEAALRSSYWPDATDQHGPYKGTAAGFIEWALDKRKDGARTVHLLGNISIELHGAAAAVESYFQAHQIDQDAAGKPRETFLCGRYVDRFERRGAEWRVAARVVTYDWMREAPGPTTSEAERMGVRQPVGAQKPGDPWYSLVRSFSTS